MKLYKQNSIFVAAVLTIVRNSSGPLLWKISWDTKYLDCNKRINHLHKNRAFTVITTIGDKIVKTCPQMESFGEQNNTHPSPLPSIQCWGVCCFLKTDPLHAESTGSSNSGRTLHGEGEEDKINIFSFLSWQNVREALKGNVFQLILLPIVSWKWNQAHENARCRRSWRKDYLFDPSFLPREPFALPSHAPSLSSWEYFERHLTRRQGQKCQNTK